jgi:stearoyl-CoA desaturase (delta-9 desaturase)
MGWLFHLDTQWDGFLGRGTYQDKVKDLASDPYYRWLDRLYFLPMPLLLLALWMAGGWFWFFWGGIIPMVYNYHVTLSVNSLTHLFGYRSFKTSPPSDKSANNALVGVLALGEGWHNNHHAFPASPKHGFFKWWEFDFTFLVIKLLAALGLVHSLR